MEFEFKAEGFDSVVARVRAQADLSEEIQDAIQSALLAGEERMLLLAPKGETKRLSESIKITPITFSPGGLGGGGFYEGSLEVGEGVPYINAVVEGTGVHGPIGGRIYAGFGNVGGSGNKPSGSGWYERQIPPAKALHFWWRGKWHFMRSVAGQEPQDEWIHASRRHTNQVLERKLREIDISRTRVS